MPGGGRRAPSNPEREPGPATPRVARWRSSERGASPPSRGANPPDAPAPQGRGSGEGRLPAPVRWLLRVPKPLWSLVALLVGMLLGTYVPSLDFIGNGVKEGFGALADAAPYIIYFTLTPAILVTLAAGSAGRTAFWVLVSFVVTTLLAGMFALLLTIPLFGLSTGFEAEGVGAATKGVLNDTLGLLTKSEPFIAIWWAVGSALLLYYLGKLRRTAKGEPYEGARDAVGRGAEATADVYRLIGVKGVELIGRGLTAVFPLVLLTIGIFIAGAVDEAVAGTRTELEAAGKGGISAFEAYFTGTALIALATLGWMGIFIITALWYTGFPFRRLAGEYLAYVYPFAWSTASSNATVPINLERAHHGLGVRQELRDFIIPLGATINLNGTMMGAVIITVIAGGIVGYEPTILDLAIALIPLLVVTIGVPGIPGGVAIIAPPILASFLPLPPGSETAFQGLFAALSFGLSDQFRTAVSAVDNGLLCLMFERYERGRARPKLKETGDFFPEFRGRPKAGATRAVKAPRAAA